MTSDLTFFFDVLQGAKSNKELAQLFFFLGVRLELILLGAAFRAHPIIGKILKRCPSLNTVIRITKFRVIDIATYCALPFHYHKPPF
jgi:hypothetical protein